MKSSTLIGLFICLGMLAFLPVQAQSQTDPVKKTEKYKVPKLSTILSTYKDSLGLPVEEIKKIIDKKLIITDGTSLKYEISSYQVLYTRNAISEDEQGNPVPTKSLASARFRSSPISDLWIKIIREDIRKAEEIYFFDIIVKDEKGHIMYAPDLKITAL